MAPIAAQGLLIQLLARAWQACDDHAGAVGRRRPIRESADGTSPADRRPLRALHHRRRHLGTRGHLARRRRPARRRRAVTTAGVLSFEAYRSGVRPRSPSAWRTDDDRERASPQAATISDRCVPRAQRHIRARRRTARSTRTGAPPIEDATVIVRDGPDRARRPARRRRRCRAGVARRRRQRQDDPARACGTCTRTSASRSGVPCISRPA